MGWQEGSRERGYVYTSGWFTLLYGRNTTTQRCKAIVLQLKISYFCWMRKDKESILIPNVQIRKCKCKSVCFLSLSHPSSVYLLFLEGIFLGPYHQYLVTQIRGLWLGSLEPRFSPSSFYHPFPYAFGARVMSFSPRQSVCWIITDKLLYVLGSPWCSSTAYTNTVLISSNHQRNKKDTKCRRSWELPHSDRRVLVQGFCLFLLFCNYEVT